MNQLTRLFETKFQNLLEQSGLTPPTSIEDRYGFVAAATVELTPNPSAKSEIQKIENLLSLPSIPILELAPQRRNAVHATKIMPSKCAKLITSIATSAPEQISKRIFGKDFRDFTGADLKELYDLSPDASAKNKVIKMAVGIAFAQALVEGVWRPAQPSKNQIQKEKTAQQQESSPSILMLCPPSRDNQNNLVFNGTLTRREYLALERLSEITRQDPTLIPVANRSLNDWKRWPEQPPSHAGAQAHEPSTLAIHPKAVQLLQNMAKILRKNPGIMPQLEHLNDMLESSRNTQPYYCGTHAEPPKSGTLLQQALRHFVL